MQFEVEQSEYKLQKYHAAMLKRYPNNAPVRKAMDAVVSNPAIVAACGSKMLKLSRDYWLGPIRDSIVGVTPEIREEIVKDLIAIDEQSLEVYDGQA